MDFSRKAFETSLFFFDEFKLMGDDAELLRFAYEWNKAAAFMLAYGSGLQTIAKRYPTMLRKFTRTKRWNRAQVRRIADPKRRLKAQRRKHRRP